MYVCMYISFRSCHTILFPMFVNVCDSTTYPTWHEPSLSCKPTSCWPSHPPRPAPVPERASGTSSRNWRRPISLSRPICGSGYGSERWWRPGFNSPFQTKFWLRLRAWWAGARHWRPRERPWRTTLAHTVCHGVHNCLLRPRNSTHIFLKCMYESIPANLSPLRIAQSIKSAA